MTRQAVVRYFLLHMAIHTPAHGHLNEGLCGGIFALGDLSVASLTLDLSENDMPTMRVEDMIGLAIDLLPGNGFPLFCKLPDFFFFRTLGDRLFVALQANSDFRNSGEGLGLVVRVTGVTGQTLFDMLLMVERDRLFNL